jgi:putative oxidoreductase
MTTRTNPAETDRIATGALVLRLALGTMFIAHALLKYHVFTLPGTAQFFASLGLPPALGYLTFGAELVGGALLVLGVYTRYVAIALVPILLGATWAHFGNGWVFSAANGGWEYPAFLAVAAVVQFLVGDGAYALRSSSTATPAPGVAARPTAQATQPAEGLVK